MVILIAAIVAIGIIAALTEIFSRRGKHAVQEVKEAAATCSTCNGTNDKCEQECMMEAATREIEYYDDEELDKYAGIKSGDYADEEADDFAYVLNTMNPGDVAGWCRSLNLRGIELPDQIKDEVIMIIGDEHS